MSKGIIFTDTKERGGRADDALSNQGQHGLESVQQSYVADGLLMDCVCNNCGKQVKSIMKWGEMVAVQRRQPLPDVQPAHQGIMWKMRCHCGKVTLLSLTWVEIANGLRTAVNIGKLPRQALFL